MSVPDDLNLTATSDLSGSGEGSHAERNGNEQRCTDALEPLD